MFNYPIWAQAAHRMFGGAAVVLAFGYAGCCEVSYADWSCSCAFDDGAMSAGVEPFTYCGLADDLEAAQEGARVACEEGHDNCSCSGCTLLGTECKPR